MAPRTRSHGLATSPAVRPSIPAAARARKRQVKSHTAAPRPESDAVNTPDDVAPDASTVSGPQLPVELVEQVLTCIDPTDTHTLANVIRASQLFWEIGAPHLYRRVTFTQAQLLKLVAGVDHRHRQEGEEEPSDDVLKAQRSDGVSRYSDRAQRAFGFIEHMSLNPPPSYAVVERLWDATLPNTPLFPNVRHLCLTQPPIVRDDYREGPRPPADVVVFDSPDICVNGHPGVVRLQHLPTNNTRSLSCHYNKWWCGFFQIRLPDNPPPMRIFEPRPRYFDPEGFEMDYMLPKLGSDKLELNFRHDSVMQAAITERVGLLVPVHFGDDCIPCVVCGRKWGEPRPHYIKKFG
ncbi:uncharacterized protein EHS24_003600 [Apiotrichum porosum]|uniref:F-box domain-containing protein n=1 Tax=Apiotrichum porosum TaxID=105984 RepID=A0A427XEF8_9TREE|nr:uncharacterized protein EHS24_003600 [Apiotrichum porosum]RSH77290.1 hypothetical protein EHS24_003600 [Apiotrichum porosum]